MIGQTQLLNNINELIINNKLPHFLVITGQKGQGKTTVVKYISDKLNGQFIEIEPKVDAIRDMKDIALKISMNVIFDINNGDKMSQSAANSLLKITEECPENVYICLELQQIENTLETIKSRCQQINMEQYNDEEIEEMIKYIKDKDKYIFTEDAHRMIKQAARNYYQIQMLCKYNIKEFYDYIDKVYENIYKVQSANSFKIAEKIDLKDTGEGYDLEMFWNMYIYRCFAELFDLMAIPADENDWAEADIVDKCIRITEKYKQKLNINGINKQSLIDMWIISIRKIWREN